MDEVTSLVREISPPPRVKRRRTSKSTVSSGIEDESKTSKTLEIEPTLAAIEAGRVKVENHLAYFSEHLSKTSRKTEGVPRLPLRDFKMLYEANSHEHGSHFVIHQHNHPIAGVHYDLRLQFSKSSSVSWSVPKGLPGNPNSKTFGRMAVETRVHNFWNHLIESASQKTGSLLIWETGTYSVLPRKAADDRPPSPQTTDDDDTDVEDKARMHTHNADTRPENEKLIQAFQTRYIRLRLHGTRLPPNYTITLRLPSANDVRTYNPKDPLPGKRRKRSATNGQRQAQEDFVDTHSDDDEDLQTRRNNAYPGSTNSIGSIHQRQWFMSLDRRNSGFFKGENGQWEPNSTNGGFQTFFVRGRNVERSVITGRLAREVEEDEGVKDFVGRQGWVAIEH